MSNQDAFINITTNKNLIYFYFLHYNDTMGNQDTFINITNNKNLRYFYFLYYSDTMGNQGAFINITGDDLTPKFTSFNAVVSMISMPMVQ